MCIGRPSFPTCSAMVQLVVASSVVFAKDFAIDIWHQQACDCLKWKGQVHQDTPIVHSTFGKSKNSQAESCRIVEPLWMNTVRGIRGSPRATHLKNRDALYFVCLVLSSILVLPSSVAPKGSKSYRHTRPWYYRQAHTQQTGRTMSRPRHPTRNGCTRIPRL